jgi:hypothetical protein
MWKEVGFCNKALSQSAEAVEILACIRAVPLSNSISNKYYLDTFSWFPQSLKANTGMNPQIWPGPLPSTLFSSFFTNHPNILHYIKLIAFSSKPQIHPIYITLAAIYCLTG